MRKMVWFMGRRYYRSAPILVLAFMAAIVVLAVGGFSRAVMTSALTGRVVVIDPGHGGYDPGAITPQGVYEKDINLAISKKIKEHLTQAALKVVLTREDDRDYAVRTPGKTKKQTDLDYRVNLTEQAMAEILVSVHVNATPGGGKSGAETFYHPDSEEGKILSEYIQTELRKVPGMNKKVAKPEEFYITRKTKITGVIVELGYLSNKAERAKLQQEWYQEELAKAIAKGITAYLARD